MTSLLRLALAAIAAALVVPGGALAGTTVGQLFPSNIYTAPDATQVTGLHVALPQPNCATNPPAKRPSPIGRDGMRRLTRIPAPRPKKPSQNRRVAHPPWRGLSPFLRGHRPKVGRRHALSSVEPSKNGDCPGLSLLSAIF